MKNGLSIKQTTPSVFDDILKVFDSGFGMNSWIYPYRPEIKPWGGTIADVEAEIGEHLRRANVFVQHPDVQATDKSISISWDVPGVKKDDIDIELKGSTVIVSTVRKETKAKFTYKIPEGYSLDSATASHEDGVITISFDKKPDDDAVKIRIR